jgi:hypothetical protein
VIKIKEQNSNYWYVFLIIGILIGAVLGYYSSEKGLLSGKSIGKNLGEDLGEDTICYLRCRAIAIDQTCPGSLNRNGCLNTWEKRCASACF